MGPVYGVIQFLLIFRDPQAGVVLGLALNAVALVVIRRIMRVEL